MNTDFDKAVRNQLQAVGLRKLPPAVVARLVEAVAGDMAVALEKSLTKRTAPKAVARVFAECVLKGERARESKGNGVPFGQLCPANASEPGTLIGTHSEQGDGLLIQEISP